MTGPSGLADGDAPAGAADAGRRVGNAVVFAGAEVGSRLIAFVATAYLAVTLGPELFGVLGFALAIVGYLVVVVDAGFSDVGSRAVARLGDSARAAQLGASVSVVRLGLAGACLLALVLASPLLEPDPTERRVLNLTGLLLLVAALDLSWVYKGLGLGKRVGVSLVVRRLLYAVLVFGFVRGPEDLLDVPLAQVAGELVGVAWLGAVMVRRGFGGMELRRGWETVRSSGALMVTKLLRTSVVTLDVVFLGLLATNRDVGLYSAPYRICFFVMAIVASIQVAYLPDVARAGEGEARENAAQRHQSLSLALGIPIAVGGMLVAGPLLELVFGAEYREGARAFQILLASLGVLFAFAPVHNVLLAEGRLAIETRAMAIAAVLNGCLNLIWIPRFGIVGAAWATLVAEVVILTLTAVSLGAGMLRALVRPLAGPLVASAVMAAGLLGVGLGRTPLLLIPLGVLIYVATLVLLRAVPEDVTTALRHRKRGYSAADDAADASTRSA